MFPITAFLQYKRKLSWRLSWSYCQGLLITGQKTELEWFGLINGTCKFWRPWPSGWCCVKALKRAVRGIGFSWSQTRGSCYRSMSARETGAARATLQALLLWPRVARSFLCFQRSWKSWSLLIFKCWIKKEKKKKIFLKKTVPQSKQNMSLGHTHPQATQRHFLGVQTTVFLVHTIFFLIDSFKHS